VNKVIDSNDFSIKGVKPSEIDRDDDLLDLLDLKDFPTNSPVKSSREFEKIDVFSNKIILIFIIDFALGTQKTPSREFRREKVHKFL